MYTQTRNARTRARASLGRYAYDENTAQLGGLKKLVKKAVKTVAKVAVAPVKVAAKLTKAVVTIPLKEAGKATGIIKKKSIEQVAARDATRAARSASKTAAAQAAADSARAAENARLDAQAKADADKAAAKAAKLASKAAKKEAKREQKAADDALKASSASSIPQGFAPSGGGGAGYSASEPSAPAESGAFGVPLPVLLGGAALAAFLLTRRK